MNRVGQKILIAWLLLPVGAVLGTILLYRYGDPFWQFYVHHLLRLVTHPLVALFLVLSLVTLTLVALLRRRQRSEYVAFCFLISAVLHLLTVALFSLWIMEQPVPEFTDAGGRHEVAMGVPSLSEGSVGQELRVMLQDIRAAEARELAVRTPTQPAADAFEPPERADISLARQVSTPASRQDVPLPRGDAAQVVEDELSAPASPAPEKDTSKLVHVDALEARMPETVSRAPAPKPVQVAAAERPVRLGLTPAPRPEAPVPQAVEAPRDRRDPALEAVTPTDVAVDDSLATRQTESDVNRHSPGPEHVVEGRIATVAVARDATEGVSQASVRSLQAERSATRYERDEAVAELAGVPGELPEIVVTHRSSLTADSAQPRLSPVAASQGVAEDLRVAAAPGLGGAITINVGGRLMLVEPAAATAAVRPAPLTARDMVVAYRQQHEQAPDTLADSDPVAPAPVKGTPVSGRSIAVADSIRVLSVGERPGVDAAIAPVAGRDAPASVARLVTSAPVITASATGTAARAQSARDERAFSGARPASHETAGVAEPTAGVAVARPRLREGREVSATRLSSAGTMPSAPEALATPRIGERFLSVATAPASVAGRTVQEVRVTDVVRQLASMAAGEGPASDASGPDVSVDGQQAFVIARATGQRGGLMPEETIAPPRTTFLTAAPSGNRAAARLDAAIVERPADGRSTVVVSDQLARVGVSVPGMAAVPVAMSRQQDVTVGDASRVDARPARTFTVARTAGRSHDAAALAPGGAAGDVPLPAVTERGTVRGELGLGRVAPARTPVADDVSSDGGDSIRSLIAAEIAATRDVPSRRAIYQLRDPVKRKRYISELGGSAETESAVEEALAWLAAAQSDDGRWDVDGFKGAETCGGRGNQVSADVGITGFTLLAFLGAGYTHRAGAHQDTIARAIDWIVAGMTADGDLRRGGQMYDQAMATAALCESISLTEDARLLPVAEKAVRFILDAQNPGAAWRYDPRVENDTSVTGWQILALKSAEVAGITVPRQHYRWTEQWLDKVRGGKEGGLYLYRPGHAVTPVMTAEGWFCQLFMGEQSKTRGQNESVAYVMEHLPVWSRDVPGAINFYYWYYATLALHLSGAEEFDIWNEALTGALMQGRVAEGPAAGTWDPVSHVGVRGGRVYSTAVATLCLEVYYRFLPFYKLQ